MGYRVSPYRRSKGACVKALDNAGAGSFQRESQLHIISMSHLRIARRSLVAQAWAVRALAKRIGEEFSSAIELILNCKGRVVICGIGKSGLVARKIAATFASTGTPSFFMHPGDAFHGDLGMTCPDDIAILISYSGETSEVNRLIPSLHHFGIPIIAMTSNPSSTLGTGARVVLDISVEREVCPLNLAPTTSTTATVALGDALAVALIQARNFQPADFARFHPGGSLGRRLLTKVRDVMHRNLPVVRPHSTFQECLITMTEGRLGGALVMEAGELLGIVTDGDVRRAVMKNESIHSVLTTDIMSRNPILVPDNLPLHEAEEIMLQNKIKLLPVRQSNSDKIIGILEIFNKKISQSPE